MTFGACGAPAQEIQPATIGQIDAYLGQLERLGFSGGVLIADGHGIKLEKAFGRRVARTEEPMPRDAVFTMGSITKPFTAAAILHLSQAGRLAPGDSLARFLPKVPADKRAITLHHLLTHTSGLQDVFGPDPEPISREEFLQRAMASDLVHPVGERYRYSNAGYGILAAVVETVSGRSYEDYLYEQLLHPAGLERTGYVRPEWNPSKVARGIVFGTDWGTLPERVYDSEGPGWNLKGNGGLLTTMRDLHRWLTVLDAGSLLRPEIVEEHVRPRIATTAGGSSYYGYGWGIAETSRGTRMVGHTGSNGIFHAVARWWPEEDWSMIVFSSDPIFPAAWIAPRLTGFLVGAPPAPLPMLADVESAGLRQRSGTYRLPNGGTFEVVPEAGGLRVVASDPGAVEAVRGVIGDVPLPPGGSILVAPAKDGGFISFDVRSGQTLPIWFEPGESASLHFGPLVATWSER